MEFYIDKASAAADVRRMASVLDSAFYAVQNAVGEDYLLAHCFDNEGYYSVRGVQDVRAVRSKVRALQCACGQLQELIANLMDGMPSD